MCNIEKNKNAEQGDEEAQRVLHGARVSQGECDELDAEVYRVLT